jgi:L-rhamnose-H+ transport protein
LIIITIPSPLDILSGLPVAKIDLTYVFGLLWGIGGLTFGLTMRYLGVGLGMAIVRAYCRFWYTHPSINERTDATTD